MAKKQKLYPYTEYQTPQELTVISLNDKGQAIARLDEYEIYLEGVIDGEVVEATIMPPFANGSKRRPAIVNKILKSSPFRCDNGEELKVGGIYAYGNLDYKESLRRKEKDIKNSLKKAGISFDKKIEIEASRLDKPSRFKSIRYFAKQENAIVNGFYKPHSHELVALKSSSIEPQWFCEFANALCEEFTKHNLEIYDEQNKQGLLRTLLLRDSGLDEKPSRLCMLSVYEEQEKVKEILQAVAKQYAIDAVFLNVNSEQGNNVLQGKIIQLTDNGFIKVKLLDNEYLAGPLTFLQVNYPIAQKLYQEAIDWCGKEENATALDLCCGVGTMTLGLAKNFNKVIGVEVVESSIIAAKENAKLNHIENAEFIRGDIKDEIYNLTKEQNITAIIADPARVGLGEKACLALGKIKNPHKLAYIFCSLKALQRDLPILIKQGYTLEKIKGFDMFPYTAHVETLVLLEKKQ